MHAAISRFRAQKADIESESREAGFELGARFILNEADIKVAKNLAELHDVTMHEAWDVWQGLESVLMEEWRNTVYELDRFVNENGHDFQEFSEGFLDGVMDVWPKIEAELGKYPPKGSQV